MTDTSFENPVSPVAPAVQQRSSVQPSIGTLFADLSQQITRLIHGEIELTKTKAAAYANRMGVGAGLLAGAAIFALFLVGWIFHSIELALSLVLPMWAASLIVVTILLVIVAVLALLGKSSLDKAQETTPAPSEGIQASVGAFKKGLRSE